MWAGVELENERETVKNDVEVGVRRGVSEPSYGQPGTVETESAAVVAMVTWGGEIPVEMRRVRPVAKVENTEYLSSCPQVL